MKSFERQIVFAVVIGWPDELLDAKLRTRTCDLESHVNREAKQSVTARAGLAEEIKRVHSDFDITEVPSHVKEPERSSNRRRKIRVCIPS